MVWYNFPQLAFSIALSSIENQQHAWVSVAVFGTLFCWLRCWSSLLSIFCRFTSSRPFLPCSTHLGGWMSIGHLFPFIAHLGVLLALSKRARTHKHTLTHTDGYIYVKRCPISDLIYRKWAMSRCLGGLLLSGIHQRLLPWKWFCQGNMILVHSSQNRCWLPPLPVCLLCSNSDSLFCFVLFFPPSNGFLF